MATDDIQGQYERAGFSSRVGMGSHPAAVVVDLTIGFTDPTLPLGAELDECIVCTTELIDAVRRCRGPVVFTTLAFDPNLADAGVWIRKVPSLACLVIGSRETELDPRLRARDEDTVLRKQNPSAFAGTPLASLLAARHVDTVIVAGATTSGCVRATVVDALQNGFATIVPRECVGDRADGPHEASLFDIDAKYADVVALDPLIAHLESLAMADRPGVAPRPSDEEKPRIATGELDQ